MIPCPSCQQPVEILDKHLGTLFSCPHCNAVYFIDWNGQPEMAQHEPEATDFEGGSDFQAGTEFDAGTSPAQDFNPFGGAPQEYSSETEATMYSGQIPQDVPEENAPSEEPYLEPAEEIPPGTEIEVPGEGMQYETSSQESPGLHMVPPPEEVAPEPVEEAPYDFSQTLDRAPEPVTNVSTPDTADFSDVTSFGNADALTGPLTYAVIIEGIESSRLLMQLKEAMTDSRFGWDVNELLNQVGGGRLVLKGLSPAKASVLISRIKYLPFKISWRQDVLSGS